MNYKDLRNRKTEPVPIPQEAQFTWTCPKVTEILKTTVLRSTNTTDLRLSTPFQAFGYIWQLSLDWIDGKFTIGVYLISFASKITVSAELSMHNPHTKEAQVSPWETKAFYHYNCVRMSIGLYTMLNQHFIHAADDSIKFSVRMKHVQPLFPVYEMIRMKHITDWQTRLKSVLASDAGKQLSDVQLLCRDGEIVPAHSLLLCVQSPVLFKIFDPSTTVSSTTTNAHFQDLRKPTVEAVLQVMYTSDDDALRHLTELDEALSLFCIAYEDELTTVMFMLHGVIRGLLTPQTALLVRHVLTVLTESHDGCFDRQTVVEDLLSSVVEYCDEHSDALHRAAIQKIFSGTGTLVVTFEQTCLLRILQPMNITAASSKKRKRLLPITEDDNDEA